MELSLRDLFLLLRQKVALLLAASTIFGGMAFAITFFFIEPTYTAAASLYVSNQNTSVEKIISMNDLDVSQSLVSTYIVIIESDTVLHKVTNRVNAEMREKKGGAFKPLTVKDIRKMLSAAAINETEAFRVSITNPDPRLAQRLVSTILDIAPKEIIRVVNAGSVEVIDFPTIPTERNWPVLRNTLLGALLGLIAAVAYVLLAAIMDTTVHGEEELTSNFSIQILGTIPKISTGEIKHCGGLQE